MLGGRTQVFEQGRHRCRQDANAENGRVWRGFQNQPRKFVNTSQNGRMFCVTERHELSGLRSARQVAEFARVAVHKSRMSCRCDDYRPLLRRDPRGSRRRKKEMSGSRISDFQYLWRKNGLRYSAAETESGFGVRKRRYKGSLRGRQWKRPEIHARDDRERPQRSNQQFMQVVACHIFHDAPAALRYHTLACNKFHAETKVAH